MVMELVMELERSRLEFQIYWNRARQIWEAKEASHIDYWSFQAGFLFSRKALRPSVASSVFINRSR